MPRHRSRIALALLALLASGCIDGWFYRPGSRPVPTPAELSLQADELTFSAPGGPTLHGWWLPADGTTRGTVVYCHGNAGNIGQHVGWVRWLPAHGFDVLVFDYRGYGRSEGTTTRAGTIADTIAAIDLALARDPERTIVFGHSLGGAIAICAAAERPAVRAVVAEGAFPSYRAAARNRVVGLGFVMQFLVSTGADPIDVLDRIAPRPLLVVHGTEDGIVPFALGLELFERASPPKQLHAAVGAGHRSPLVAEGESYERLLLDFFAAAIDRDRR